jgi:hypothetical protein
MTKAKASLQLWSGSLWGLMAMGLVSCKEPSGSPSIPKPETSVINEGAESNPPNPDEELPSVGGAPTTPTGGMPGDPTIPGGALPAAFQSGIDGCKQQNRYYDLKLATCTDKTLANFNCDVTVLLSAESTTLTASQKTKLKEYMDANLLGFTLYACTSEENVPMLHFYKVEADRIRAHNVKIVNPASP